jgi:hypothetical protein
VFRKQRGRPLKFGRPAQFLALTLPHDVVHGLRRIHPDPAWAIVSLYERLADKVHRPPLERGPRVELARLSPDSALIVVDPQSIHSVPGVSVVPVAAGRAFLAFGEGRGLADLEVAVLDRLRNGNASPAIRRELTALHRQIRDWRRSRRLRFSTRSIIIVEHGPRPLLSEEPDDSSALRVNAYREPAVGVDADRTTAHRVDSDREAAEGESPERKAAQGDDPERRSADRDDAQRQSAEWDDAERRAPKGQTSDGDVADRHHAARNPAGLISGEVRADGDGQQRPAKHPLRRLVTHAPSLGAGYAVRGIVSSRT